MRENVVCECRKSLGLKLFSKKEIFDTIYEYVISSVVKTS